MFKKIKAQLKDASDRAVVTFFVMIFWTILKLRYRIVVINADAIRKIQKGALFLSNHTSLLDAVMVGSVLWRNCRPRPFPVAVEEHYYSPLEYWYLSRVRTVPIPDFSSGTFDWKEEKLEKTINQILNGLKEKKSVMLFPSGTMKHTARENLDGSSIIHRLLQRSESTNICLVRITGLWGSSFSREGTSKCPTLESGWGKRIFQILVNGFFFMPKRKIVIEFEPIPLKALGHSVPEINSQLEKWYNAPSPDGEPAIHPPHYFWQKESPSQIPKKEESEEQSLSEKEILLEKEVIEDIAKILSIPCETLTRDTKLGLDLGLDSLDIAQLALYFETKYDLGIVSFNELHLISDIIHWIEGKEGLNKPVLVKELVRPQKKVPSPFCCGDLWNAPLQAEGYEKLINSIKKKSRKISSEKVGLMLLNSMEATATLEALYRLKKIPVLINWLNGDAFIKEIHAKFSNLPIITNKDFFHHLNLVNVDGLALQFIRLYDMKVFRSFSGSVKADRSEISSEIFLQYFVIDSNKMDLKTVYRHELQSMAQKVKSMGLKQDEKVVLIHPFTDPYEIAMNAVFLMLGYPVFFLSSYRIGSKEMADFLVKWNISRAFCCENLLERLKLHLQQEKIKIQSLNDITNKRGQ